MDSLNFGHLDINSVTKELRKDSLSIKNRLQSILYDAYFIDSTLDKFHLPLIPNERCGLWYIAPDKQRETSYFKSTDGHTGQWSFSLRRLNFHLLPLIGKSGGIAIIDSTRKGKLMPDALLKTIPIWCAVLNYILFEGDTDEDILDELKLDKDSVDAKFILTLKNEYSWVLTPKSMVSGSERNEISKLISSFAREVKKLDLITKDKLLSNLSVKKPLIPQWHFPGCRDNTANDSKDSFYFDHLNVSNTQRAYFTIQCVTASKKTNEYGGSTISVRNDVSNKKTKLTSWYYIQGSADDHELWATKEICNGNLGPRFFWQSIVQKYGQPNEKIIDIETGYIYDWLSESELILRINSEYDQYIQDRAVLTNTKLNLDVTNVKNNNNDTGLIFGIIDRNLTYQAFCEAYGNAIQLVILSESFTMSEIPEDAKISVLQYKVESSKKGSKKLREIFPEIIPKLKLEDISKDCNLLILCDTGKDISTGLVLALLCKYFDLSWEPLHASKKIDKDLVRQQLGLLQDIRKVNPSRNTLQSVNTFIM